MVCCGSGGVGKTTTAAVLGIWRRPCRGRKVVVVTIDPAQSAGRCAGPGGRAERASRSGWRPRRRRRRRRRRRAVGDDARHGGDVRAGWCGANAADPGAGRPDSWTNRLLPQHGRRAERHAGVHGRRGAAGTARRCRGSTWWWSTRRRVATPSTSWRHPACAGAVPRSQTGLQAADAADPERPARCSRFGRAADCCGRSAGWSDPTCWPMRWRSSRRSPGWTTGFRAAGRGRGGAAAGSGLDLDSCWSPGTAAP